MGNNNKDNLKDSPFRPLVKGITVPIAELWVDKLHMTANQATYIGAIGDALCTIWGYLESKKPEANRVSPGIRILAAAFFAAFDGVDGTIAEYMKNKYGIVDPNGDAKDGGMDRLVTTVSNLAQAKMAHDRGDEETYRVQLLETFVSGGTSWARKVAAKKGVKNSEFNPLIPFGNHMLRTLTRIWGDQLPEKAKKTAKIQFVSDALATGTRLMSAQNPPEIPQLNENDIKRADFMEKVYRIAMIGGGAAAIALALGIYIEDNKTKWIELF